MTAALIVIEVAAPEISEDSLSVLVSACTRAARNAECVLAKDASDQPSAVAIVSVQGEDKMRVEVGIRQGDHDSWRTKDFNFVPADENEDRFRAVGFAIGTLAESNAAPETEVPPSEEPSAPAPPAPPPIAIPPHPVNRPLRRPAPGLGLSLGASVLAGPGLKALSEGNSSWKGGGALYADLELPRLPVFFSVGGSAATLLNAESNGSTARWFELSLGGGVSLLGPLQASGLEARIRVEGEYFDVNANAADRSETRSRATIAAGGSLGARLQIASGWLLTAEAGGAAHSGTTTVLITGHELGENPTLRYSFSAGLRVRLR